MSIKFFNFSYDDLFWYNFFNVCWAHVQSSPTKVCFVYFRVEVFNAAVGENVKPPA